MGAAIEKGLYTVCIGFDMSRAFDTVPRKKIIEVLQQKNIDPGDINIINTLLNNTKLRLKRGKEVGDSFVTNIGVPQGDGLSPRLFITYLH